MDLAIGKVETPFKTEGTEEADLNASWSRDVDNPRLTVYFVFAI